MDLFRFARSTTGAAVSTCLLSLCVACAGSLTPPSSQHQNELSAAARAGLPPRLCSGNAVYVADYKSSVIDSFDATGGSAACTVTSTGVNAPMGIWVQPVSGAYHNRLFVANAGNGTAVEFKTPLRNTSVPERQFDTGGVPNDVVQDMSGNVYVSVAGSADIEVFAAPLSSCAYPTGCAPSFAIKDPCGNAYWLATDGKGDVYSDNTCGYVTLFVTPITSGQIGTKLVGTSYTTPGGMILDKHNRLVVDDVAGVISSYRINVLASTAALAFSLAAHSGTIYGIGLDKENKFLWVANTPLSQGERYSYASGGTGPSATATDSTLVNPFGAAVRPSSKE
jgi:hypothetical protein